MSSSTLLVLSCLPLLSPIFTHSSCSLCTCLLATKPSNCRTTRKNQIFKDTIRRTYLSNSIMKDMIGFMITAQPSCPKRKKKSPNLTLAKICK